MWWGFFSCDPRFLLPFTFFHFAARARVMCVLPCWSPLRVPLTFFYFHFATPFFPFFHFARFFVFQRFVSTPCNETNHKNP